MSTILCPLDNRRSTSEVISKLMAAHIVSIVAYIQLFSLRGEKVVWFNLPCYIIAPLYVYVQLGISLLLSAIAVLVYIIRPTQQLRDALKRVPLWLFAHEPAATNQRRSQHTPQHPDTTLKALGKLLVVFVLLVQSCGTIYIYSRRESMSAVTRPDIWVFHIGLAGLLVSILSLGHLLRLPLLNQQWPMENDYDENEDGTWLGLSLASIRGIDANSSRRSTRRWYRRVYWSAVVIPTICYTTIQMTPQFPFFVDGYKLSSEFVKGRLGSFIVAVFCAWGLFILHVWEERVPQPELRMEGYCCLGIFIQQLELWGGLVLLYVRGAVLTVVAIFGAFYVVISSNSVALLIQYGIGLGKDGSEMRQLSSWPVNEPCPKPWSDTRANFIWQVA